MPTADLARDGAMQAGFGVLCRPLFAALTIIDAAFFAAFSFTPYVILTASCSA